MSATETGAENSVKIKTAYPGLHIASGVKPGDIEVIKPTDVEAKPDNQASSDDSNPNTASDDSNPNTASDDSAPPADDKKPAGKIDFSSLSDEERLEALQALTGGKIKSFEELEEPPAKKSPEQIEKEKQQRSVDALSWALETNLITKSEYESAIINLAKTDRELALENFTATVMEADDAITEKEAAEMFKDYFNEELEPTEKLYILGQKRIEKIAEKARKGLSEKIDGIEPGYDEFTNSQSEHKNYRSLIRKVAGEMKELSYQMPYKDVNGAEVTLEFKVPIEEKVIKGIIEDLSNEKAFQIRRKYSGGKVDEKVLAQEIQHHVKAVMYDTVLPQMLAQNTTQVEQRMIAILGNKRSGDQSLNSGRQTQPNQDQKPNTYPGLHEAMKKQNKF